ncbi:hypothetical protein TNIN_425591 [Trichonephila inaurata madagascariensis]|uniref:Uncharacterized protein n=1 Tax=Trichonephila inaurata madagascariensis TaxID=2747483 RepID=A0A8X6IMD4_9ARAC|nr:hypothetical protein TNIN_425591 [Trichonephila inaurata madagascariensis]
MKKWPGLPDIPKKGWGNTINCFSPEWVPGAFSFSKATCLPNWYAKVEMNFCLVNPPQIVCQKNFVGCDNRYCFFVFHSTNAFFWFGWCPVDNFVHAEKVDISLNWGI